MASVRRITISGFRGLLTKLDLELQQKSVIIYGRNGTGKSSVTDAWEWLTTGKIHHLSREGAEEGAYPHTTAKPGQTYVEVEFSDKNIGVVGLHFDHERVTMPVMHGKLEEARKLILHPCHIRFSDLTRFVYLRKADRYDALAPLMGFVGQMEYQKALRRVQGMFEKDLAVAAQVRTETEERLCIHFTLLQPDVDRALEQLAGRCRAHGMICDATLESVASANAQLKQYVANDPKAKMLADMQSLELAVATSSYSDAVVAEITALRGAIGPVKHEQKEHLQKQLLIPLFEAANLLFDKTDPTGFCPLCGKVFEGDLHEHVTTELASMRHLAELLEPVMNIE
jgi:hypothetical protein